MIKDIHISKALENGELVQRMAAVGKLDLKHFSFNNFKSKKRKAYANFLFHSVRILRRRGGDNRVAKAFIRT